MNIRLIVKPFGGSDITSVCNDICGLATKIEMLIECEFNGVLVWAYPNDDPFILADRYFKKLADDSIHKIASIHHP